jgi:hypothetical protein
MRGVLLVQSVGNSGGVCAINTESAIPSRHPQSEAPRPAKRSTAKTRLKRLSLSFLLALRRRFKTSLSHWHGSEHRPLREEVHAPDPRMSSIEGVPRARISCRVGKCGKCGLVSTTAARCWGCGKLALIAQEGRPLKRCPDGDRNLIRVVKTLIWGLIALISIPMRRRRFTAAVREFAGLLSIIVLSNALLRRRGAPQPHSHRSRRAPVSPADPQREGPHSRRSPIAEVLLARGAGLAEAQLPL